MSRLVGECSRYNPGAWDFKCPREHGVKDSEKCSSFREDCGYYAGTEEPPKYHGIAGGMGDDDGFPRPW